MTFDEALAKVVKLRALSQSNNANEAAAAAAAAERIMQQFRIESAQVEAAGDREELPDDPVIDEKEYLWGDRVVHWQVQLVSALCNQYSCRFVLVRAHFEGDMWKQGIHTFGRKTDVAIVRFQYAYLSVEITRLCEANGKGKGRAWRNSYCMGAVQGIREAMYEAARKEETKVATSTALVLLDERGKLATGARDSVYPKLGKARTSGSISNGEAYRRGKHDGAGLTQRSALPGRSQRLLQK